MFQQKRPPNFHEYDDMKGLLHTPANGWFGPILCKNGSIWAGVQGVVTGVITKRELGLPFSLGERTLSDVASACSRSKVLGTDKTASRDFSEDSSECSDSRSLQWKPICSLVPEDPVITTEGNFFQLIEILQPELIVLRKKNKLELELDRKPLFNYGVTSVIYIYISIII